MAAGAVPDPFLACHQAKRDFGYFNICYIPIWNYTVQSENHTLRFQRKDTLFLWFSLRICPAFMSAPIQSCQLYVTFFSYSRHLVSQGTFCECRSQQTLPRLLHWMRSISTCCGLRQKDIYLYCNSLFGHTRHTINLFLWIYYNNTNITALLINKVPAPL